MKKGLSTLEQVIAFAERRNLVHWVLYVYNERGGREKHDTFNTSDNIEESMNALRESVHELPEATFQIELMGNFKAPKEARLTRRFCLEEEEEEGDGLSSLSGMPPMAAMQQMQQMFSMQSQMFQSMMEMQKQSGEFKINMLLDRQEDMLKSIRKQIDFEKEKLALQHEKDMWELEREKEGDGENSVISGILQGLAGQMGLGAAPSTALEGVKEPPKSNPIFDNLNPEEKQILEAMLSNPSYKNIFFNYAKTFTKQAHATQKDA